MRIHAVVLGFITYSYTALRLTPTQTELLRVKTNASQQQIQLFAFTPPPEICSVRPSANLSLGDGSLY